MLLRVAGLADAANDKEPYPTFIVTSHKHWVYAGEYRIIQQKEHFVEKEQEALIDYLMDGYSKKSSRFTSFLESKCIRKSGKTELTRKMIRKSITHRKIRYNWIVLEFIGFNIGDYETLLEKYRSTQPFSWRNQDVTFTNLPRGFHHVPVPEVSAKRAHEGADTTEQTTKRRKGIVPCVEVAAGNLANRSNISDARKLSSAEEEDGEEFTIVVDVLGRFKNSGHLNNVSEGTPKSTSGCNGK